MADNLGYSDVISNPIHDPYHPDGLFIADSVNQQYGEIILGLHKRLTDYEQNNNHPTDDENL